MPEKLLLPGYATAFRCTSSNCEDTCCRGWQIAVDRETFDRYRSMPVEDLRRSLMENIALKGTQQSPENYAAISLHNAECPLLTTEGLCRIQKDAGEGWLSLTCANYPRNFNRVNGRLEMALDMSCPEAARLALLDPAKMRFATSSDIAMRTGDFPEIDSSDSQSTGSLHGCFEDIRGLILSLLQNRSYCLEDRLIILGRFCLELEGPPPGTCATQVAALMDRYENLAVDDNVFDTIASVPNEPAALLKPLVLLLEYRLKSEAAGPRFAECFEQFKLGLQYTNYLPQTSLSRNYAEAKVLHYDGFISRHGYMLENYFVNHVFKTLFPLGPQKCAYVKRMYMIPKSVFEEYMLLVMQFAMLKNMLIGLAGYYGEEFDTGHALQLIQSFAKSIDHDIPYQQRLLQFFQENNMLNLACTAMLIRN